MSKPTRAEPERKCLTCGEVKLLSEFPQWHRDTRSGWRWHCRRCDLERRNADPARKERNRVARREYMRTYQRKTPRKRSPQLRDPVKTVAQTALNTAVAAGRVVRPKACQRCGAGGRINGHHHDYSLPLDVVWLCTRCHAAEHYGLAV